MPVADFDSLAAAQTAAIDPSITYVRTAGYYALGDGGGATYVKVSAPQRHNSFFSSGSALWTMTETHVNLLQFGARSEGSRGAFDNSKALDDALLYCRQTGARTLEVPGLFRIGKPVRPIDFQIEIWGQGPNRSAFYRGYDLDVRATVAPQHGVGAGGPHLFLVDERGLLAVTSGAHATASGSIIRGIGFQALAGTSGGCAISVVAGKDAALGNVVLDNISISAEPGGSWGGYGLVLDGSANTVDPVALRTCNLSRLNLFGDSGGTMLLRSVRYASILGGLYNQVPGASGAVVVTGSETLPSQDITIVAAALCGLRLSHVEQFTLVGAVTGNSPAIVADPSAVNCTVYGVVYGSPQTPTINVHWTGASGIVHA